MRYLLDSHILIWAQGERARVSQQVKDIIEGNQHTLFVSIATIWELSIKQGKGKLQLPNGFFDEIIAQDFSILPVSFDHARAVATLPPIHGDPFDRLLVAQAKLDDLTLITHDDTLAKYGISVLLN